MQVVHSDDREDHERKIAADMRVGVPFSACARWHAELTFWRDGRSSSNRPRYNTWRGARTWALRWQRLNGS